jgi:hypothetical protein
MDVETNLMARIPTRAFQHSITKKEGFALSGPCPCSCTVPMSLVWGRPTFLKVLPPRLSLLVHLTRLPQCLNSRLTLLTRETAER